jgi:aspartate/methionine/tyrosine aminotransferase
MRVGYVVAAAPIMDAVRKVSTHQIYDLSDLNQEAALAALTQLPEEYSSFLAEQTAEYGKARDLLHSVFPNMAKSPGGAYLFVPFEDREQAWSTMVAWLDQGVSSAPGEAFGGLHPHCLRLCFTATPYDQLEKAVEIIRKVGVAPRLKA